MTRLLFILLLLPSLVYSQSKRQKRIQKEKDELVVTALKKHVQYLASDELEGRRTGTQGEKLAMQYIANQYKEIGLEPKGNNEFIQEFTIDEGFKINESSFLKIKGNALVLHKDYFPLPFSAQKNVSGSAAIELREAGEPWFIDVAEWLRDNNQNPHYDIYEQIKNETKMAASKGATAILLINNSRYESNIQFNKNDTASNLPIPVIFISKDYHFNNLSDKVSMNSIELNVSISRNKRSAHNVVAYINNNAANTIILGAHFDHLGYGEDKNALDTGNVIHNGADDNASGTAALIELARMLKNSQSKNNNYLFISFSGEELGLMGSKYWLENPSIQINPNYMLNMDMVGRYEDGRKLTIGGYGTSPIWSRTFTTINEKQLQIKFDSSGSGPSDHASFYRKDIPVLFFFTGSHSDYHKATDDAEKINYAGELQIIKLINNIINTTNQEGKLAFLKTTEPTMGRSTRFTVSLGVIPDYGFSGTGMRIDGVSPGKVAEKIGLQAGDILLKLGDYLFVDVSAYMKALSHFKKGDKTILRIKRGDVEKEFEIEF
jgi:aminopeptidase YwaD